MKSVLERAQSGRTVAMRMSKSSEDDLKIKREVLSRFEREASTFDLERMALGYRLRNELVKKLLIEEHRPHASVLDLGCGTGEYTQLSVQIGYEVVGGDASRNMLSIAKQKIRKHRLARRTELVRLESTRLPFRRCSFDDVTCIAVLDSVPNYHRLLAEARRVLKPDGRLFACVDSLWSPYRLFRLGQRLTRRERGYTHAFSSMELKASLTTRGFRVERLFGDVLLAQVALRLLFDPKGEAVASKVLRMTQPLDYYLTRLPLLKAFSAHYFVEARKTEF